MKWFKPEIQIIDIRMTSSGDLPYATEANWIKDNKPENDPTGSWDPTKNDWYVQIKPS